MMRDIISSRKIMIRNIILKAYSGKKVHCDASPNDTIEIFKSYCKQLLGSQYKELRFVHANKQLKQGISLQEQGIKSNSTINVSPILRGGSLAPIIFNSMQEPIKRFFSESAPKWRIIGKGLNLQGICVNKHCEAFGKKVWIIKGYGKFNMSAEVYKTKCPICDNICQKVENMGLFKANCVSKGLIKGEKKEKLMQSFHNDQDSLLTFQDKDETQVEWLYLEMEVKPY